MIGVHIVEHMVPVNGSVFEVWNGLRCVARSMLVDERRAVEAAVQGVTSLREHAEAEWRAVRRHRESILDAVCREQVVRA